MSSKVLKYFYSQPLLFVNTIIEGLLGFWMILAPSSIQSIGEVNMPLTLIRVCGLLAISVAIFSKMSIIFIGSVRDHQKAKLFVYCSLAIFNTALSIGLLVAALEKETNYLGVVIHLPLMIAFWLASRANSKQQAAQ